jgi:hypothetical protein
MWLARRRGVATALLLAGATGACVPRQFESPLVPTVVRGSRAEVLRRGTTEPVAGVVELATAESLVVRTQDRAVALSSQDVERLRVPETPGARRQRAFLLGGVAGAVASVLVDPQGTRASDVGVVATGALIGGPLLAGALLPTRYRDAMLPSRLMGREVFLLVPEDGYPEQVGGQRVRLLLGGTGGGTVLIGSLSMRGRDSLDVYDPEVEARTSVARADVVRIAVSRGPLAATPQDATLLTAQAVGLAVVVSVFGSLLQIHQTVLTSVAIGVGGLTAWAVTRERWTPATITGPP